MRGRVFILVALLSSELSAADPGLPCLVDWLSGDWDNIVQVRAEADAALPETQRHARYAMRYQPIAAPAFDGQLFAIHNYGAQGFAGPLRRISLHRFYTGEDGVIVHEFLFLRHPEYWAPLAGRLHELRDLQPADVRSNPDCRMYWHWQEDHYEGRTEPGRCITQSFTDAPIRVEGHGKLWPHCLLRHDLNLTLNGEIIPRPGGETPELFRKLDDPAIATDCPPKPSQ
ncbi:MAG: hypothetical protein D6727_08905 [Gammaproteobacteria bacterium]|nr:MAG: hypothetical protein D6727_08905 [Gammaproteobacteria bacterium]